MKKRTVVALLCVAIVVLLVVTPMLAIWALNALGFAVALTFKTWLAALALLWLFGNPGWQRSAKEVRQAHHVHIEGDFTDKATAAAILDRMERAGRTRPVA